MGKEVIYIYGKTMESITERYNVCKQAVSNLEDTLTYVDIKVPNEYRPAMEKLMEDIDANLVSAIYVSNVQTISRDAKGFARFKNHVDCKGVRLVIVDTAKNSLEEMLTTIMMAIDEWEAKVGYYK